MSANTIRVQRISGDERTPSRFAEVSVTTRWHQVMRLLEIELRRSPGVIGAVAIALATFWMMWQELPNGVVYWEGVNRSAVMAMAPVAAIAGGIAAWAASRDHRRQSTEQMTTMSFPQGLQQALGIFTVTAWSITGYLTVALGFYAYAGSEATWAGPVLDWPLLVVGAIIGATGLGWLAGTIWPGVMTPLALIGGIWGGGILWETTLGLRNLIGRSAPAGAEMGPEGGYLAPPAGLETFFSKDGAWRFLIPFEYRSEQIPAENVTGWALLWMAGLGVAFFLLSRWWKRRTVLSLIVSLGALAIAAIGGTGAAAKYDTNWGMFAEQHPPQVCTTRLDDALTVCLHEKQEALLPETADIVAELLSPIAGRTWVPMHWESGSSEARPDLASGTALINFYDRDEIENLELHQRILMNLLAYPGGPWYGITGGDYVVLKWMLEEAGISRDVAISHDILPELPVAEVRVPSKREVSIPDPVYLDAADVDLAIDRFLALTREDREAWLDANWSEVFTGTLTLDDLP